MDYTLKDVLKEYFKTQPKMDFITKITALFGHDIIGKSFYGHKAKIGEKIGFMNIWNSEYKDFESTKMITLLEGEIDRFCEDYELLSSRSDYIDFDNIFEKPTTIQEEIYYTAPKIDIPKENFNIFKITNRGFIDIIKKEKKNE